MIKGTGLDIIEIDRVRNLVNKQPRFAERILTEREMVTYNYLNDRSRIEFLAGRFAAKEAFSKALGTGIGKEVGFLDIVILADEKGKPFILEPIKDGVHLSITHCESYAAAQVIIEENK